MKTIKQNFYESIKRGLNEEVGSIDSFSVNGTDYSVIKTGENEFSLFEDDSFLPIMTKSTNTICYIAMSQMGTDEIGNHESDLYLKCTDVSKKLVSEYRFKNNVETFRSNIDGSLWYDIPFAYDPF